MGIDVIILSRGREQELDKTLRRLASTKLNVIVMHNNQNNLASHYSNFANINYVFRPGANYGERAFEAIHFLRNEYCIISSDDDGLVEIELNKMEYFLKSESKLPSVGGLAIGAFPYGNYVAGILAYNEMRSYQTSISDKVDRVKAHFAPKNQLGLPRTALYRLWRREPMVKVLTGLGGSSNISTPYVYEITAELLSAWLGNTIYLDNPYWIRNWKNKMISKGDWNRQFGFDSWWDEQSFEAERENYLSFLSNLLNLEVTFLRETLSDYASRWRDIFRVPSDRDFRDTWNFGRRQVQQLKNRLLPHTTPSSISKMLSKEFPDLDHESRSEILMVANRMFFQKI